MDIRFETLNSERETRTLLWNFYCYAYAPAMVRWILFIFLFSYFCMAEFLPPFSLLFGILAATYAVLLADAFPRYWRRMRNLLRREGAFEIPAQWHLFDTGFEMRRGGNVLVQEYRVMSCYFLRRGTIFLLRGNGFSAGIGRAELPDEGAELLRCLHSCGVKELRFFAWRRWLCTILLAVAVAGVIALGSCRNGTYEVEYMPEPELVRLLREAPSAPEILRKLGEPGNRIAAERDHEVWYYRYPRNVEARPDGASPQGFWIEFDRAGKPVTAGLFLRREDGEFDSQEIALELPPETGPETP